MALVESSVKDMIRLLSLFAVLVSWLFNCSCYEQTEQRKRNG